MESAQEVKLCSNCGKNPRVDQRDKSTNTQCSDCKRESHNRCAMNKAEQDEAKAFHKGVEAMRELIASGFEKYSPIQKWTGPQFATIVRGLKAPQLKDMNLPTAVAS